MRKITAFATAAAAGLFLVGCANEDMDGTYRAEITAETNGMSAEEAEAMFGDPEALNMTYEIAIDGGECTFTVKSSLADDVVEPCEVDQGKRVIRLVGDSASGDPASDEITYSYEPEKLTLHMTEDNSGMDFEEGQESEDLVFDRVAE